MSFMLRQHNLVGGGAQTNAIGLSFERDHDLKTALINVGYKVDDSGNVFNLTESKIAIARLAPKYAFYHYLKENKIDWSTITSKLYLPDEALFNFTNKTLYIIEKKYQGGAGSVDEKLQTFPFKKERYEDLVSSLDYKVKFYFQGSTYFQAHYAKYLDVWKYYKRNDIQKYIAQNIPLKDFEL